VPVLTAARCTTEPAAKALFDRTRVLADGISPDATTGIRPLSELNAAAQQVKRIPVDDIADGDRDAFATLFRDMELKAVAQSDLLATLHASSFAQAVQSRSVSIARANVNARVDNKKFLADLESVTKEALQGEACELVRQLALPGDESQDASAGDEKGWADDLIGTAKVKMSGRGWAANSINALIAWTAWGKDVAETGQAISSTSVSHPDVLVFYVSRPAARQAAIEYVKICHAVPKKK
jgi:hypothetical protein